MRKLFALIGAVALMALPIAAAAQQDGGATDTSVIADAAHPDTRVNDTGVTTDAGAGCGNITIIGTCVGTDMTYCVGGALDTFDCAADGLGCGMVDCAEGGQCTAITAQATCTADTTCTWSTNSSKCYPKCWGYDCVAPSGGECMPVDLNGDGSYEGAFCEHGLGCVNGVCVTGTACDSAAEPPVEAACGTGNTANSIMFCHWTDFMFGYDCTGGGAQPYVCGVDSTGASTCLGAAGGDCDITQGYECATGLHCSSNSSAGTCVSGNTDAGHHDTGVHRDSTTGGTDKATADDSSGGGVCGCSGVNAGASALAIVVAMLGLAMIRRRR